MSRYVQRPQELDNPWSAKSAVKSGDGRSAFSAPQGQTQEEAEAAGTSYAPSKTAGLFSHFADAPDREALAVDQDDDGPGSKKPAKPGPGTKDPRFNPELVRKSWIEHNIDPAKAEKIISKPLFGHPIQVNEVVAPLVDKTNSLFSQLEPAKQQKITQSIVSIGGYAKRTTNGFGFSLHSIGSSVDINPNMALLQNHEWRDVDDPLLGLYEGVVQTDPEMAKFDLLYDKGLKQIDASEAFNRRFPSYLRGLIAEANAAPGTTPDADEGVTPVDKPVTQQRATGGKPAPQSAAKTSIGVAAASESLPTLAEITAAIAAANKRQNPEVAQELQLIKSKWKELNAWLYGANLGKGKLVGMVALDRTMVSMMLQGGWTWGGDWDGKKDYMHFDDPTAEDKLRLDAPTTPSGVAQQPSVQPADDESSRKTPDNDKDDDGKR